MRLGEYYISKHGDDERQNDNLMISEVGEALLHGRIIEQYEDTGRGASCLVAGFSNSGKPMHIVRAKRSEWLVLVTIYVPGPPKFKSIYERG